jgi:serine O-acetyltransferase
VTTLFSLIKSDFIRKRAIYIEDGAQISLLRVMLTDGSSANVIHRLAFACAKTKVLSPFALLFQHINRIYNGCSIGTKANFSDGLALMHPIGVVINSKVIAGKNITIESGVVIGDEKGLSPSLGDNVFIGAGAKIIGNVTVGNNVKIGANAVVVKDIPDNCTALGIPAISRLNER